VTRHDAVPPVPATPDHTPGHTPGTAPDHTPDPTPDAKPDRATDATRGPAPAGRAAQPPWAAPADPAPGVALRAMTRADLPAVLRLEHDLFGDEAWSEAMLVSELEGAEASGRYYLVAEDTQPAGNGSRARPAEDPGRLVGYAGLLSPGGGQADVLTMAVARERWGQRVGALLLDALVAEAARRGCTDVFLEVRVDNDRAQRLYRSRGFAEIGIRRGYYQPSGTDALVMQLSLPRPRRFGFSGTRRSGTKHGDPQSAAGGPR
jgi:ribosomal-protein-alanine N-acetyltransferase